MRNKLKMLEVDAIGGQKQPLTNEEELLISSFIKSAKAKKKLKTRLNPSSKKVSKQIQ